MMTTITGLVVALVAQPVAGPPPEPLFTVTQNDVPVAQLTDIRFTPDGEALVTANWGAVRVWDYESGEVLRKFTVTSKIPNRPGTEHEVTAKCMDFNSDFSMMVTGQEYGQTSLWDFETGERLHLFEGHDTEFGEYGIYSVKSVDISRDDRYMLTTVQDESILWDFENRSILSRSEFQSNKAAISPDGTSAVIGGQALSIPSLEPEFRIEGEFGSIEYFSEDGRFLYRGAIGYSVFDWANKSLLYGKYLPDGTDLCFSLDASPDNQFLVVSGIRNRMYIIDFASGDILAEVENVPRSIVKFNPSGELLALGNAEYGHPENGTVNIWRVSDLLGQSSHTGGYNLYR